MNLNTLPHLLHQCLFIFSTGYCQCNSGMNRGPCKHKAAIQKHYSIAEFSCLPDSDGLARASWHYIANGSYENPEWYRQHDQPHNVPNVQDYVEDHRHQVDLPNVISTTDDENPIASSSAVIDIVNDQPVYTKEDRGRVKRKFVQDRF